MTKTYEIHIDESGDFERPPEDTRRKTPVRVIGGVVIPSELKEKEATLKEEMITLAKPYLKKIERVTDIHVSDIDKLVDSSKQNELKEVMLHFFNTKMPEAKIVFIYDTGDLAGANQPPGAQLYRHLLLNLLKAIVFYHLGFDSENVLLDIKLAHRRIEYPKAYDLNLSNQGYLKVRSAAGQLWYTAINEKDLKSIMLCLQDSLGFACARKVSYGMMPYTEWDSPFMTTADLICNKLFGIAAQCKQDMKKLHSQLLTNFGGNEDRIFFYCSSDYDLPENILRNYHLDKPGQFIADYIGLKPDKHSASNNLLLVPALQKSMAKLGNIREPVEFDNILKAGDIILNNRQYSRIDNLMANLIKTVKNRLESISENDNADAVWDPIVYKYHDVCLRYYNHTGNVAMSRKYMGMAIKVFERMEQKEVSQIRNYHELINRASIIETNEFSFKKAIHYLEPIKEKEQKLCATLTFAVRQDVKNEILGKIFGSLAQNYAFLKKNDDADACFKSAKIHLGEADFKQACYRAYWNIDKRNKSEYEEELRLLFKIKSPASFNIEQLLAEYVGNIEQPESPFILHLLLKGVLVFYDHNAALAIKIDAVIGQNIDRLSHHPWQLIFIVMGRLFQKLGQTRVAGKYWDAAINFRSFQQNEITFDIFRHCARAWKALSYLSDEDIVEAREIIKPVLDFFKASENGAYPGIFNPKYMKDKDGKVWPGWFDEVGKKLLEKAEGAGCAELQSILKEFISRFTFNYW